MAKFKKGVSGNPKGGKLGNKGGTGRPSNDVKERARKAFKKGRILEYWTDVATGKKVEEKVIGYDNEKKKPIVYKLPADTKDRLNAGKMVKELGHGKDDQPISGEVGKRLIFIFPEGSDD